MANTIVYFIRSYGAFVKIGITTDLKSRLKAIQAGCPIKLTVIGTCPGDRMLEAKLHHKFHSLRVRNEWFHLTPEMAEEIKNLCKLPTTPTFGSQDERLIAEYADRALNAERKLSDTQYQLACLKLETDTLRNELWRAQWPLKNMIEQLKIIHEKVVVAATRQDPE